MTVFFTTLGLNASFKLIKRGGSLLIKYWLLCGILAISQNIISVLIAKIIHINPLIALMCGTISLEGGHGNAVAFGNTIEKLGVKVIPYDDVMRKGIDAVLEEIGDYLKVSDIHISFDVDSLNPKFAPGVSTPVKNGFDEEDIFKTFKFLFKNYFITSVDIVEYNPIYDKSLKTAAIVRDITEYMLNPIY